jgi:ADP-ribose pyrophosphatase YjhB (NUDIX family)
MNGPCLPDVIENGEVPRWLVWARELQAIAQTGLTFATGDYDLSRYRRLMEIAAEITAGHTGAEDETVLQDFLEQPGYATPKVDVRGAVIKDGKILLVQEKSDGGWCMPGGWADVGDMPSAMVAREVVEESGLIVRPCKVIGVFDANHDGRPLAFYHAYKIVFLCDLLGGEPRGSDETLDARFFDFDAIPPLSGSRTQHRHLEEIRAHLADPQRPVMFD